MNLNSSVFLRIFPIVGLLLVFLSGCGEKEEVIPAAINRVSGTVDGTYFETKTTEVATVRNDELFAVTGIINEEVQFALYFRGSELGTHVVSDTGVFVQTIDYLRDVAQILLEEIGGSGGSLDSIPIALIDSLNTAFDEIFADSASVLGNNEAFMFYVVNENIYYSRSGNLELTAIDTVLNRMSGTFEIELRNLPQGRKNLVGTFEELQYFE
jgi:hypothetical protein